MTTSYHNDSSSSTLLARPVPKIDLSRVRKRYRPTMKALIDHSQRHGYCYAGWEYLADKVGRSERTVQRYIERMSGLSMVERVIVPGEEPRLYILPMHVWASASCGPKSDADLSRICRKSDTDLTGDCPRPNHKKNPTSHTPHLNQTQQQSTTPPTTVAVAPQPDPVVVSQKKERDADAAPAKALQPAPQEEAQVSVQTAPQEVAEEEPLPDDARSRLQAALQQAEEAQMPPETSQSAVAASGRPPEAAERVSEDVALIREIVAMDVTDSVARESLQADRELAVRLLRYMQTLTPRTNPMGWWRTGMTGVYDLGHLPPPKPPEPPPRIATLGDLERRRGSPSPCTPDEQANIDRIKAEIRAKIDHPFADSETAARGSPSGGAARGSPDPTGQTN